MADLTVLSDQQEPGMSIQNTEYRNYLLQVLIDSQAKLTVAASVQ